MALKKLIQAKLHEKTMQGSKQIDICLKLMGVSGFWNAVASNMMPNFAAKDIRKQLNDIATRRNQIVHEADFIRKTKNKNPELREIRRPDAEKQIEFIVSFVEKVNVLF